MKNNSDMLDRIKARAKQIRDLKRNPRMIIVPWRIKTTKLTIIETISNFTAKMVDSIISSRYSIIPIRSTVHTRGRIIKRIKKSK